MSAPSSPEETSVSRVLLVTGTNPAFSVPEEGEEEEDGFEALSGLLESIENNTTSTVRSNEKIAASTEATVEVLNQIRRQLNDVDTSLLDLTQGLERLQAEARNHSTAFREIIHLVEEGRRNNQVVQTFIAAADAQNLVRSPFGALLASVVAVPRAVLGGTRRAGNWILEQPPTFWAVVFFLIIMTLVKMHEANPAKPNVEAQDPETYTSRQGSWETLFKKKWQACDYIWKF